VIAIQTARLELRPMFEDDLDALVELDGFAEVRTSIDPFAEHIPDDPTARREYERRFLHPAGYRAAIERATGRFVGWFQFEAARDRARGAGQSGAGQSGAGQSGADLAPTEIELGYRFRPDAWGQGFASEGAAALLADALRRPDVIRVYAHALLSNGASIGVMQKIGMTYAAPWSYRGLPGAEYEARPGAGPLSAPAKRP
jgi:RimJ/RimL family protein N-acetyltransferase